MREAARIGGVIALIVTWAWAGNFFFFRRGEAAQGPDEQICKEVNHHLIDSAASLVKSGDVLLRSGIGADSYMLARMNLKDKTYSHCGIVLFENGYPFVYHAIGGEDNPDERLRRDSIQFFLSPEHNKGFAIARYNCRSSDIRRIGQTVHNIYRQHPRFDMKFDLATDDYLYCTEFVYKALNRAMNDTGYIKTTSFLGHVFVAVDNLFINEHAHFVWQAQFK